MVVRPDPINRQDRGLRVQFGGKARKAGQALRPRVGAEGIILERETSLLHLSGELLGERTGDKAPEDITHNKPPHAAVGFLQGHQATQAQGGHNAVGDLGRSKAGSCEAEQACIILTVKQDPEVFGGAPRGAGSGAMPRAAEVGKQPFHVKVERAGLAGAEGRGAPQGCPD